MKFLKFSFFSFISFIIQVLAINQPYNIRFAVLNENFNGLTISWSTKIPYNTNPIIEYGLDKNNLVSIIIIKL